jgi:hypothetical protein
MIFSISDIDTLTNPGGERRGPIGPSPVCPLRQFVQPSILFVIPHNEGINPELPEPVASVKILIKRCVIPGENIEGNLLLKIEARLFQEREGPEYGRFLCDVIPGEPEPSLVLDLPELPGPFFREKSGIEALADIHLYLEVFEEVEYTLYPVVRSCEEVVIHQHTSIEAVCMKDGGWLNRADLPFHLRDKAERAGPDTSPSGESL